MSYMMDRFVRWISEKKRKSGSPYSKETISNYVTALKTYSVKLTDLKLDNNDLFFVDNVKEFTHVYETIRESRFYDEINRSYHRIFSSAIEMYKMFLEESDEAAIPDGGLDRMSINSDFEEWLKQYPDHKYTDNTIKRYLNALYKAGEWLDISLDTPIMSIDDYQEFNDLQNKLKNLSNYKQVNQTHGHGDLSAALSLYEKFLLSEKPGYESGVTTVEAINRIKKYISYKGFSYDDTLIENFCLALMTKPFVILAGTSGTGKTKLVKLFAEAIGAEYKLVSVRPDWSDSSDLFGYTNLQGKFIPGAIIEYINEACLNQNKPYFLCLDEMNLARVEYYLSDFLSLIETRKWEGNKIITEKIKLDSFGQKIFPNIYLPENLYFIGTVNMDETTFPFSKKVLDRANTIEFSKVDLIPNFELSGEFDGLPMKMDNSFLKSKYITLINDISNSQHELAEKVCVELQSINEILQKVNVHVGYRVRDEIVFYMLYRDEIGILNYEGAMDNEIMQKILPRIQGSSQGIKELLAELFKKFAGDYSAFAQDRKWEQMSEYLKKGECIYKKSAEKICYMMRRFEEDGFTSYWI